LPGRKVLELYGWENLKGEPSQIIICEGEFDRLVLEANGFKAVTATGGARAFKKDWVKEFESIPEVYICFDNDKAGKAGALRVGRLISHAKIVELPTEIGDGGDVTDYFVRLGRSREDFSKLLQEAKPPSEYKEDALHIRNKLLLFRFRNLNKRIPAENLVDRSIEPRLNQIFVPLLSIIEDPEARRDLQELAKRYNREMIADRGMDMEAQILEIIRDMMDSPYEVALSTKDIASWFADRHGMDYEKKITTKWIGTIIRKKLGIKTQKSHGIYRIPPAEWSKLERLYEKYGIKEADDSERPESDAYQPTE